MAAPVGELGEPRSRIATQIVLTLRSTIGETLGGMVWTFLALGPPRSDLGSQKGTVHLKRQQVWLLLKAVCEQVGTYSVLQ